MRKSRKVGYIGVDKAMLQSIRNKIHNITFFDIRNSKHKIFDIVIHTDSLSKEENY